MLQIAGNCALQQKHKDKKIRTHLAKTRTKESTAFRFGSSQVYLTRCKHKEFQTTTWKCYAGSARINLDMSVVPFFCASPVE